jgi:hypothetical protein
MRPSPRVVNGNLHQILCALSGGHPTYRRLPEFTATPSGSATYGLRQAKRPGIGSDCSQRPDLPARTSPRRTDRGTSPAATKRRDSALSDAPAARPYLSGTGRVLIQRVERRRKVRETGCVRSPAGTAGFSGGVCSLRSGVPSYTASEVPDRAGRGAAGLPTVWPRNQPRSAARRLCRSGKRAPRVASPCSSADR